MYKAEILGSLIENGMLTVSIRYSDGVDTFDDVIQTNQKQDDSWVRDAIARKLKELEGIKQMLPRIPIGPVHIDAIVSSKSSAMSEGNVRKEEYRNDLEKFNKFLEAMRKGATDDKNAQFIALKEKLKKNFDASYLDLF